MGSTESSYVCFYEQENLWKSQGKKKIANLMLRYKSGFFLPTWKNYFEDYVSENQFKIEYFSSLPELKTCLE